MQKVDNLFKSSFDQIVENIFRHPIEEQNNHQELPMSNVGDYIDLYREKKGLEAKIADLEEQVYLYLSDNHELKERLRSLKTREEKLLKQNRQLQSTGQNKNLFLANMSHEIRTPMNGIIGAIDVLDDTDLQSEQRKYLGIIETCALALLSVVDDILDYSKIEANELKIETIDFNLKDIVGQVRDILIFKAQEKGIEFTTHIVHNVPVWLKGDPLRIRQVLLNLANNAIKFTEAGSVSIEISMESENKGKVTLDFKVKDTGIGIKKEQQQNLFKNFSQVNSEITRQYGGTGLGLAISKRLTELMKGRIGVESIPDKGSSFQFSIPLVKQKGTQKNRNDLVQLSRQKIIAHKETQKILSVLLVEDDFINQKITSLLLEKEGFKVKIAENGIRAMEILKKNIFDLVLMDVEMPEMNGYDTTRKIRASRSIAENTNIPIIAMTAHAMSGIREKCLEAGMSDYISKPLNMNLFNEVIERFSFEKVVPVSLDKEPGKRSNSEAVIDLEKLEMLRKEVDSRFGQVVDIFLSSLPQKMANIRNSLEQENYEDLQIYAHQLKGSSATFYAQKMVALSQKIESLAEESDFDKGAILELMELLEVEIVHVEAFLKDKVL
jgi:signal transduction histidine kinase/CheY-like chemotaxis protein